MHARAMMIDGAFVEDLIYLDRALYVYKDDQIVMIYIAMNLFLFRSE